MNYPYGNIANKGDEGSFVAFVDDSDKAAAPFANGGDGDDVGETVEEKYYGDFVEKTDGVAVCPDEEDIADDG